MTFQDRIRKSKKLYNAQSTHIHTLQLIEGYEDLWECTTCGGAEGTLWKDCPGFECSDLLDQVYRDNSVTNIAFHWRIMLIRAKKRGDLDTYEMIRSTNESNW